MRQQHVRARALFGGCVRRARAARMQRRAARCYVRTVSCALQPARHGGARERVARRRRGASASRAPHAAAHARRPPRYTARPRPRSRCVNSDRARPGTERLDSTHGVPAPTARAAGPACAAAAAAAARAASAATVAAAAATRPRACACARTRAGRRPLEPVSHLEAARLRERSVASLSSASPPGATLRRHLRALSPHSHRSCDRCPAAGRDA